MIASVTGTLDTVPIIFTQVSSDRWEITVPPDLEDGKYIVEITAEDEAGNQTYQIAELYMWQNVVTKVEILKQKYTEALKCDQFSVSILDKLFDIVVCDPFVVTSNERYKVKLVH